MVALTAIRGRVKDLSGLFYDLGARAQDVPLIGNWGYVGLTNIGTKILEIYIDLTNFERWVDGAAASIASFLTWDQIRTKVLSSWSWLNTIDDKIRQVATDRVRAVWSWIDDPVTRLWDGYRSKITSTWTWLNSIDDKIRQVAIDRARVVWPWIDDPISTWWDQIAARAVSSWTWLNSIDDKIQLVAWEYIRPRILDFLLERAADVANTIYRVLNYVWNLEWSDEEKKVKP